MELTENEKRLLNPIMDRIRDSKIMYLVDMRLTQQGQIKNPQLDSQKVRGLFGSP